MPAGFAPRFVIEAGFLVLLGVGAGYANLRTPVIVALVAGGWIIVSLVELAVWRSQTRPLAPYVPPPAPVEDEPELAPEPAPALGEEPPAPPADEEYPLRADPGAAPSEEVEAYTRVLADGQHEAPPVQAAE